MIYLIEPTNVVLEGCKAKCTTLCWVKPMYGVPIPCEAIAI